MDSKRFVEQVTILIKARYPLLYVLSSEEQRVEKCILEVGTKLNKKVICWSSTEGLAQLSSPSQPTDVNLRSLTSVVDHVLRNTDDVIFVLKDAHPYLEDPQIKRRMRDLARTLPKSRKSVVLLSPFLVLPSDLEKEVTILDFPLPNQEELNEILNNIERTVQQQSMLKFNITDGEERERILRAALGLTYVEAENAFAKALVTDNVLDAQDIPSILEEKKQIIRKSGVLEYYDSEETISSIGGLEVLKEWVRKRTRAFSEEARKFGLPEPKGILLLGVQGCGKSLSAKAISAVWHVPLLRLDMGAIFGKYIGESEGNLRNAIRTAESIAPAILWIDELEKGFSGLQGESDAGTTARVFGSFLTWMQEKKKPVFVVATSNDVTSLPPELLRKGRFDEIFFVDLPTFKERIDILKLHLIKRNIVLAQDEVSELAEISKGFSGAELEEAVISALYDAFDQSRSVQKSDLSNNIGRTVPLSVTMSERIEALRTWARNRAVHASLEG